MLSVCRKNKEINFFQDIGDSTSLDLELAKDGINDTKLPNYYGSITGNAYRKSNFFITFGCLVSADQPTINYKSRLRRKLAQTLDFSQIPICQSKGLCIMYSFERK